MSSYHGLEGASERGAYQMLEISRPTAQHMLDERRRAALAEIDDAPFSFTHVKICVVAGVGFFTDAYGIFAINIAARMLGYVYSKDPNDLELAAINDLRLKIATPLGIVIGQLFFGWLADIVGRKKMYGAELIIIIVATFSQAVSANGNAINIIWILFVWRFLMGIGIGGDYPLSAVMTSEFSATKFRGRMMTAVMSAQGFGNLASALVGLIAVSSFRHENASPSADSERIDKIWRILVGFGCVPAVIGLFFRLTISETPRFTMDIARNIDRATHDITKVVGGEPLEQADKDAFIQRIDAPRASWNDFMEYFGKRKNFIILLCTSWSWFALDIAFYGLGLNTQIITDDILTVIQPDLGLASEKDIDLAFRTLRSLCVSNIIVSATGLLPGYFAAFFLIDAWGRKRIQLMGFIALTIVLLVLGATLSGPDAPAPRKKVLFFLYCLANFFQNFGPNVSTFVIPGEVFPTRYRSTAYGISAACGKIGAIIAQLVFYLLRKNDNHARWALIIFALFMLTGIASTLPLPETKGRTLEELSNEKQEGFVRGATNWVRPSGQAQFVHTSQF